MTAKAQKQGRLKLPEILLTAVAAFLGFMVLGAALLAIYIMGTFNL